MKDRNVRVLVCGGRKYTDRKRIADVLGKLYQERSVFTLIHGAAPGADTLAAEWAAAKGLHAIGYPADWAAYGKAAGVRRNQWMLEQGRPDLVVAFPGGNGTADMVRRAKAAGLEVIEVHP